MITKDSKKALKENNAAYFGRLDRLNASEVTIIWRYMNLLIIIIIFNYSRQYKSQGLKLG